jgi:hypothetical protein
VNFHLHYCEKATGKTVKGRRVSGQKVLLEDGRCLSKERKGSELVYLGRIGVNGDFIQHRPKTNPWVTNPVTGFKYRARKV